MAFDRVVWDHLTEAGWAIGIETSVIQTSGWDKGETIRFHSLIDFRSDPPLMFRVDSGGFRFTFKILHHSRLLIVQSWYDCLVDPTWYISFDGSPPTWHKFREGRFPHEELPSMCAPRFSGSLLAGCHGMNLRMERLLASPV